MTALLSTKFASVRSAARKAGNLVLAVDPKRPDGLQDYVDAATAALIRSLLARGDLDAKAGKLLSLPHVPDARFERVLLVAQPGSDVSSTDYRSMCTAAATAVSALPGNRAHWLLDACDVRGHDAYAKARIGIAALAVALYRHERKGARQNDSPPSLKQVDLGSTTADRAAVERAIKHGVALAEGMQFARDLGNAPPNELTPAGFAAEARKLARASAGRLRTRVLGEKEMRALGMHSLLAVGAGSVEESKLIVVEYKGAARAAPYVLVGKGITFDTGGISIKPAASMDEMKFDMCGAGAVLGSMHTVARLGLPINLVGVVAAAENMPSGTAMRPGDVVRSMSGQTIEILNTDAEGRLVLCDALTYVERYKPAAVIDLATLTGGVIVALGSAASGLWSNNDALAMQLRGAADESGDKVWQMPLWEEYQPLLKSNFADMANVSGGREAQAIAAACFLSRFAKAYPWAHLDIAGTAYRGGAQKGATARPMPLLLQFLLDRSGDSV